MTRTTKRALNRMLDSACQSGTHIERFADADERPNATSDSQADRDADSGRPLFGMQCKNPFRTAPASLGGQDHSM